MDAFPIDETSSTSCSKRLWVMSTLTDDDPIASELPLGMRSHLSRCESCRALVRDLRVVNNQLELLGALEPSLADKSSEAVLADANERLRQALKDGARLTGRVEIPDEPFVVAPHTDFRRPAKYARYAVAAVLAFAAVGSAWWSWQLRQEHNVGIDTTTVQELPSTADNSRGQPGRPTRLANTGQVRRGEEVGATSHRVKRNCREQGYDEFAVADDGDCIPRAFPMSRRGRRFRPFRSTSPVIDSRQRTLSTTPPTD